MVLQRFVICWRGVTTIIDLHVHLLRRGAHYSTKILMRDRCGLNCTVDPEARVMVPELLARTKQQ